MSENNTDPRPEAEARAKVSADRIFDDIEGGGDVLGEDDIAEINAALVQWFTTNDSEIENGPDTRDYDCQCDQCQLVWDQREELDLWQRVETGELTAEQAADIRDERWAKRLAMTLMPNTFWSRDYSHCPYYDSECSEARVDRHCRYLVDSIVPVTDRLSPRTWGVNDIEIALLDVAKMTPLARERFRQFLVASGKWEAAIVMFPNLARI